MTEATSASVVIVGGGPTGVTTATLLALHGIDSLVLDRWDDVYPQPRAVHLDDEVYRILGKLGIADAFARLSRPALGLQVVESDGRVLARFERSPDVGVSGYPQANLFDQPELERLLRARLAELPQATLRPGAEVIGLSQSSKGESVSVDVRDLATGAVERISARFVLGCDGANSMVRKAIGSTMRDLRFEQNWLVVDIATTAELEQWDGVHQLSDPRRAGTFMRIGPTRYRWEFRLLPGESAASFASTEALLPLIKPWTGETSADQLNLIRCADYTFRAQIADHWRQGSCFLLGDAAHLTPPFIGQGMCAGIRDAYNLTWKLAAVLHGGRRADEILDSYQLERRPHALKMIQNAMLIGYAMTGGGLAGHTFRAAVLPRASKIPGIGRAAVTSETPRLHRSALIACARNPRALEGRLCPNAVVDGRYFDNLACGYVVVTREAAKPDDRRYWTAFGAEIVQVDDDSTLGQWLKRGFSAAALVRPDGTVRASASRLHQLADRIRS